MEKHSKVAEKIGKLLAKAEGTDNPHERDTFLAAAERLMVEWGVEEAVARAAAGEKVSKEEIVEVRMPIDNKGEYGMAKILGLTAVLQALGLRTYRAHNWTAIYIVGHKSDAEKAEMLLTSLHVQMVHAMWTWWKNEGLPEMRYYTDNEKYKARCSFYEAFGRAVARRIRETKKEVVDATPGSALVLADRSKEVDEYVKGLNLRNARSRQGFGYDGERAGTAAGRNANLGGSSLSGRKALS